MQTSDYELLSDSSEVSVVTNKSYHSHTSNPDEKLEKTSKRKMHVFEENKPVLMTSDYQKMSTKDF